MKKSNRFKVEIELTTLKLELLEADVVRDIIIENLKHHFSDGKVKEAIPLKAVVDEFCLSHSCPLDENYECPRCKEEDKCSCGGCEECVRGTELFNEINQVN